MFNLGEKIFYPGHGVALVQEIVQKIVAGNCIKFFKLTFLFKDMTVLVPVNNFESIGIRALIEKDIIKLIVSDFSKVPEKQMKLLDFTPSGWNRRNKDYHNKIQGGKVTELAQIYKDLMYISKYKELSFGEKSLLQIAEDLLTQEFQTVLQKEKEFVLQILHDPFKNFFAADLTNAEEFSSTTI